MWHGMKPNWSSYWAEGKLQVCSSNPVAPHRDPNPFLGRIPQKSSAYKNKGNLAYMPEGCRILFLPASKVKTFLNTTLTQTNIDTKKGVVQRILSLKDRL